MTTTHKNAFLHMRIRREIYEWAKTHAESRFETLTDFITRLLVEERDRVLDRERLRNDKSTN